MTQQTHFLLWSLWEVSLWRDMILTDFEHSVQNNASRNDIKKSVKAVIEKILTSQATEPLSTIEREHIDWEHFIEFLCLCFYSKRFRRSLPEVPSYERWIELTEANWGWISRHPQQERAIKETVPVPFFPLEQTLLQYGGKRMVFRDEPDLSNLLQRGEVFDGPVEIISGMSPHHCHANVARQWSEHRNALMIGTGYGLSEDGLWRQHSWLLQKNPTHPLDKLLETTFKRMRYFGFLLTEQETEQFYQMNA